MNGTGVVEDLYYWVADGTLDTLLPLQNYFSVFYPELETAMSGTLILNSPSGKELGRRPIELAAHALLKLRLSQVIRDLGLQDAHGYGTLLCDWRIPDAVAERLNPKEPFYFWDRFYIGYLGPTGQPCFVHGVDKTFIAQHRSWRFDRFYPGDKRWTWIPEIPINLTQYPKCSIIMVNRTHRLANLTLQAADRRDTVRQWSAEVAPHGVHRFVLDRRTTKGLDPVDIRLQVEGMPTRYGRPVVFKEFENGAISALHC